MTFDSETTDKSSQRLRFAFTIEGVETVFVDAGGFSPATLFQEDSVNRTQSENLLKVDIGETRLDLEERRSVGGGLTIELTEDNSGTLGSLFQLRADPVTTLCVGFTAAASVVSLALGNGATSLPSSGHVYIGRETFRYTGRTGSALTGVQRSKYGSKAAATNGNGGTLGDMGNGLGEGEKVYSAPPSWLGRRAFLYAGYVDSDGVCDDVELQGVWYLSASPRLTDSNTYVIECAEVADLFASKEIYTGIDEIPLFPVYFENPIPVGVTAANRLPVAQTEPLIGLFTLDDGTKECRRVLGHGSTFEINVADEAILLTGEPPVDDGEDTRRIVTAVQPTHLLEGPPAYVTLNLLISDEGTGGGYDVYAGKTSPDSFAERTWRMGAAIENADIDTDAFWAADTLSLPWRTLLFESMTVGDVLKEFCFSTGSFWYVNTSGQLTVKKLRSRYPRSEFASVTIDDSINQRGAGSVEADESQIHHTAVLRANYDPLSGRSMVEVSVRDEEAAVLYQEGMAAKVIDSKMLDVKTGAQFFGGARFQRFDRGVGSASIEEVQNFLRRTQVYSRRPLLRIHAPCTWKANVVSVGDVVSFDDDDRPDLAGGTTASTQGLVLAKRPNPDGDGSVELLLQEVEPANIFAPAHTGSAVGGSNTYIDLDSGDAWNTSGANVAEDYNEDWTLVVYNKATALAELRDVSSISGNRVTFTASFTAPAAASDLVVFPAYGSGGSISSTLPGNSVNGVRPGDLAYQVADDYPDNGNASSEWS